MPRNVIALISGGKDSFYSLLHCIHQGHRIVALANLYPLEDASTTPRVQVIAPEDHVADAPRLEGSDPTDLNSFMYQTVGHEVIPLYAAATGIPLYRYPIVGGVVRHERDYHYGGVEQEETEAMIPLLKFIQGQHPEAEALCAGAILSTYQRTRVESISLRLGLVPLAFLWQYPSLPTPTQPADDAQLLLDMGSAGLEARIIKVASAGLDETHLWMPVTGAQGAGTVKAAMRRFGVAHGAALGEGGEFETLVVDGPGELFMKRIVVPEEGRRVVREDGGTSWLVLSGAYLEDKPQDQHIHKPRTPDLLDARFKRVAEELRSYSDGGSGAPRAIESFPASETLLRGLKEATRAEQELSNWFLVPLAAPRIEDEMADVVETISAKLEKLSVDASQIINTIIILRNMGDFSRINGVYGKLFTKPNPPARVTISCGELLPEGCNLAVHLVTPRAPGMVGKEGLHVQSQSHWAPANIGPYSQAIGVPITVQQKETGLRVVSIAGQIPLIPASMTLPAPSPASVEEQIVLSLQHLWRIGEERKIQYWTSAVAYFARQDSEVAMRKGALLAGRAWQMMHEASEDEDGDEGPDLWDRTHNPQYMSLDTSTEKATSLPDFSILPLRQQNEPSACVPPFFAVEVEGLPRQATVEWHAHLGISGVADGQAEHISADLGIDGGKVWHTTVRTKEAIFLHSVLWFGRDSFEAAGIDLCHSMVVARNRALQGLGLDDSTDEPYLTYVDVDKFGPLWKHVTDELGAIRSALIPCRSIWSIHGGSVGVIALYRTTMSKGI